MSISTGVSVGATLNNISMSSVVSICTVGGIAITAASPISAALAAAKLCSRIQLSAQGTASCHQNKTRAYFDPQHKISRLL